MSPGADLTLPGHCKVCGHHRDRHTAGSLGREFPSGCLDCACRHRPKDIAPDWRVTKP